MDDKLRTLKIEIRVNHKRMHSDPDNAVTHAARCGAKLIEAQRLVKRGEWVAWVNTHAQVSYSRARLYMRLAKAFPELTKEIDFKNVMHIFSQHFSARLKSHD